MSGTLKTLSIVAALTLSGAAMAQDDSSASAAAYPQAVQASEGAIIRVPVAADGKELLDQAELRLTTAVQADQGTSALENAFESGTAVSKDAILDENSDSSTSHWGNCGWNNWGGYNYGYNYNNYNNYYNYQPSYSYYQSQWSYQYSYSYQSSYSSYNSGWGNNNYYGNYGSPYNNYNYYYYQPGYSSYYGNNHGWHGHW